jgi:hypothetical protein
MKPRPPNNESAQTTFEEKLNRRVERYDASGATLLRSLLDLAYAHELPMGIEYLDREALAKPLHLELHNESVRGVLLAIVEQVPEYKVSFSEGLVDIYVPTAREDPSNLLNKVIKSFAVSQSDTHKADMELFCALSHEIMPSGGCGGSVAIGQWGPAKVNVHLQNAKVYEILNTITSQNGKAVWTVIAPPDKLSKLPFGGLWHIYPLELSFKEAVLNKLMNISLQ